MIDNDRYLSTRSRAGCDKKWFWFLKHEELIANLHPYTAPVQLGSSKHHWGVLIRHLLWNILMSLEQPYSESLTMKYNWAHSLLHYLSKYERIQQHVTIQLYYHNWRQILRVETTQMFLSDGWEPWLVESPDWLRALIGWEPWPQPDYYLLLSVCPVITLGSSWILGEQDDIQWLSVTWLLEQADVPSDWLRHLKAQVDYKKYIHHSSLTPVVVFAVVLWHLSSPSLLVITLAICLSCRW